MKLSKPIVSAVSLAVALAMVSPASAQERAPAAPTTADQKALDEARRKLDEAAKAYAELAGKHGTHQFLRKPVVGVVLAPDTTAGVRIVAVTPGGAAAEAGLKSGDRLIAVDGTTLAATSPDARVELARAAIARHDEKSKVQLRYIRDGKEKTVVVSPKAGDRLMFIGDDGRREMVLARQHREAAREAAAEARAAIPAARRAAREARVAAAEAARVAAIAPEVRREIIRLAPNGDFPVLADALRWNGLNLASVDADLGKYFGTDKGVLVLSTGPELDGLKAGDVIRSVAGKDVDSPREVMEALRGRKAGSKVDIGYLRDRKTGTALVTVPEPMQFHIPAPPAPPAPPPPPAAPHAAPPPAPPAPPALPLVD